MLCWIRLLLFAVDLYVVVLLKNHPVNLIFMTSQQRMYVASNANFWLPGCATDRYKLRNSRELKHSVQQFF